MGFQIKNAEGEALTMGALDKEAADFWGVEVHPKYYASPNQGLNWFDTIGYAITDSDNYRTSYTNFGDPYKEIAWVEVANRMTLCNVSDLLVKGKRVDGKYKMQVVTPEEVVKTAKLLSEMFKPFFDLMKYWEDKGYTPHRV